MTVYYTLFTGKFIYVVDNWTPIEFCNELHRSVWIVPGTIDDY